MKEIEVVRTKLRLPPERRERVSRAHLLQVLDEGLNGKLILLSGPAGFGKTTLLSEWIRTRDIPTGWLSIDEGDNDLSRFLAYVVYAIQSTLPETPVPIAEISHSAQTQSYEPLLPALINSMDEELSRYSDQDFLLVLDDYHLIEEQAVHDTITYLLEHLPTNLHLVISSRADPPIPLARLRALAQLTELRMENLRFSYQEAAEFLNRVMSLDLNAKAVQALSERTEGWIAGLQMAAVSMQGRDDKDDFIQSFTGSNRFILDYLLEEVLQRQTEAIQKFLIHTSILDRFCGTLCDAVINGLLPDSQEKSQSILEYLEKANLFVISLDDRRQWYRYHRLFADLLKKRLIQTNPKVVSDLHQRASEWFEDNDDLEQAIEHAFLGNDVLHAANLIEQAAEANLMRSEFITLQRWMNRIPSELLAARPTLSVFQAWILFMTKQPMKEIEKYLALIPTEDELVLIKTYPLRALIAGFEGSLSKAGILAYQALEKLPEGDTFLRSMAQIVLASYELSEGSQDAGYQALEQAVLSSSQTGNILASVMMLSALAENCRKRGQLRKVETLYRQALGLSADPKGKKLLIAGRPLIGLGELMREWNQLEAAEDYLEEGMELFEQWGDIVSYSGYISLSRLRYAQGNPSEAMEMLTKAGQVAIQTESTAIDNWVVAMVQASLWVEQGEFGLAENWIEQRQLLQELDETCLSEAEKFARGHLRKYEWVVIARLRLRQGKPDEALYLLEQILPEVERIERIGLSIEIHNLKALAFQQKGLVEEALHSLEAALDLAEPEGYVRVFLDEGESLEELLSKAQARGISPEYIDRLLAAFEQDRLRQEGKMAEQKAPNSTIHVDDIESLSEREMEVLSFLRSSLTVPEIAETLCVADSTVRSHIKSIYNKLNVHRRFDAIQRAYELNLFQAVSNDRIKKPAKNR